MESDVLKKMLYDMLLARAFEERAAQEYAQGNIAGFLHAAEPVDHCNRHEEVLL